MQRATQGKSRVSEGLANKPIGLEWKNREIEEERQVQRGCRTGEEPDYEGILFPMSRGTVGIQYKALSFNIQC